MHLAPRCDDHDMGDDDPRETFGYAMEQLGKRKIAFFFTREYLADDSISEYLKAAFRWCAIYCQYAFKP